MSNESKKSSYISGRESRRITRFNRRVTKKLEKARADARSEKERVLSEARGEVADLALLAAAKLLGSVDEETDRRLLDDWLAEMGGQS